MEHLLSLFARETERAVESCQMGADQVRIMLSRTRGVELHSIMKADFSAQEESITSMLQGEIGGS